MVISGVDTIKMNWWRISPILHLKIKHLMKLIQNTCEEPATKQYFYLISLYQCENMAIKKCHLELGKEGAVICYKGVGKVLYDHPKTVKAKGDNHYYSQSIVCLLSDSQSQHFAFRQLLCSYVPDEKTTCTYSPTFHLSIRMGLIRLIK